MKKLILVLVGWVFFLFLGVAFIILMNADLSKTQMGTPTTTEGLIIFFFSLALVCVVWGVPSGLIKIRRGWRLADAGRWNILFMMFYEIAFAPLMAIWAYESWRTEGKFFPFSPLGRRL